LPCLVLSGCDFLVLVVLWLSCFVLSALALPCSLVLFCFSFVVRGKKGLVFSFVGGLLWYAMKWFEEKRSMFGSMSYAP
jgi:hypothetical protein